MHIRDSFLMQQDQSVFEHHFHFFGISYEIWGNIPSVELHAFDDLESRFRRLGFFNRNHSLFTNLFVCLSHKLSDARIVVSRDRGDLLLLTPASDGT